MLRLRSHYDRPPTAVSACLAPPPYTDSPSRLFTTMRHSTRVFRERSTDARHSAVAVSAREMAQIRKLPSVKGKLSVAK
ncbi:unnamed protein product, partial [Iphiclides podalirius]